MKPETWEAEEAKRDFFKGLLRATDIEFDEYSLLIIWADSTRKNHPEGRIEFNFHGALTFEALEQISHQFGTRRIDVGCDHGTSSDPSHERVITIYGAHGL
jgi:hypothetical protein